MKQEYLTRKKYEKPRVTVVTFAIERGFQASRDISATGQQMQMQGYASDGVGAWGGSSAPSSGGTFGGYTNDGVGAWN